VTNGLPDGTGQSFVLLFSFQLSFFLWTMLGLFLLLPFALVFFSPISHIYYSFVFLHPTVSGSVGPTPPGRYYIERGAEGNRLPETEAEGANEKLRALRSGALEYCKQ